MSSTAEKERVVVAVATSAEAAQRGSEVEAESTDGLLVLKRSSQSSPMWIQANN